MRHLPLSTAVALFTEDVISAHLRSALQKLAARDEKLFHLDVSERSLTHKIAEYLAPEFPGWDVDCEYNRDGLDAKSLPRNRRKLPVSNPAGRLVFPDIIVHKRGTEENLLVIEAKKDTNPQGSASDAKKLLAFKNHPSGYRYKFAALVILNMSSQASERFSVNLI